jgi:two-component system, NarL family, sensor histidine kinase UhpB
MLRRGGLALSSARSAISEGTAQPAPHTGDQPPGAGMSLRTRVFLMNSTVLGIAVLVLVVSPATVSSPVLLAETLVLMAGLTVIMLVNLVFFRRAFAPLVRLTELMRTIDLLEPGRRVPVYGTESEVADLTLAFNEMLDRLEEERRQSATHALDAQEGERQRVARELHDEVGQSLTAVVLQLGRVERTVPAELRPEVAEVRETARASLEEVRQIAQRLRPEALDELGLQSALETLAERVADQGGLRVGSRLDDRLPTLSATAELVIYRVAQEALTNTLRHARASHAVMALRADAEEVVLSVIDDGRGLQGRPPGAGIQGMRERAMLAGARIDIRDRAEGGVEVRLALPAEPQ